MREKGHKPAMKPNVKYRVGMSVANELRKVPKEAMNPPNIIIMRGPRRRTNTALKLPSTKRFPLIHIRGAIQKYPDCVHNF